MGAGKKQAQRGLLVPPDCSHRSLDPSCQIPEIKCTSFFLNPHFTGDPEKPVLLPYSCLSDRLCPSLSWSLLLPVIVTLGSQLGGSQGWGLPNTLPQTPSLPQIRGEQGTGHGFDRAQKLAEVFKGRACTPWGPGLQLPVPS